jgi:hypothetical protein
MPILPSITIRDSRSIAMCACFSELASDVKGADPSAITITPYIHYVSTDMLLGNNLVFDGRVRRADNLWWAFQLSAA